MKEEMKEEMKKEILQDAERKGVQAGIQQGIKILIESCKEFALSYEQTIHKIAEKYELPIEKAEEYMKKFW